MWKQIFTSNPNDTPTFDTSPTINFLDITMCANTADSQEASCPNKLQKELQTWATDMEVDVNFEFPCKSIFCFVLFFAYLF